VRVAFVHSIRHYGSTERTYLTALLEGLDRGSFTPWLVIPDDEVLAPLRELEPVRDRVRAIPLGTHALGAIGRYRSALRSIAPDLVHCVDVDSPAMLAARLAGVRRLVVTHHTPELEPAYNLRGRVLRRLAWATLPHVVFTSDADRATALDREPIERERATVIPLGIDLERLSRDADGTRLREELPLGARPVVGSVGRLATQKGHTYLLQAAELLRDRGHDVAVVLVGDGSLRSQLEREAEARGLAGNVFFLGERDDVPELVAGFDVFALSSNFEGQCLAVGEALAAGVPVVATDVGGVGQTIVDGETGVLVPPRDPEALADGVAWTLENRDEALRLAAAGRKRVWRLYRFETMVDSTQALYRRVLGAAA
jgi:glycosyltransferase involved in cell wall biosynthesis